MCFYGFVLGMPIFCPLCLGVVFFYQLLKNCQELKRLVRLIFKLANSLVEDLLYFKTLLVDIDAYYKWWGTQYVHIFSVCISKLMYINWPIFMRHYDIYYTPNFTHYDSVPWIIYGLDIFPKVFFHLLFITILIPCLKLSRFKWQSFSFTLKTVYFWINSLESLWYNEIGLNFKWKK